jgi:GxxExxY protein
VDENQCSRLIIGAAIEVHRHLGPGLLESAYERALAHELGLRGLGVESQVRIPMSYKGVELGDSFRIDLLVERLVIVEVKTVDQLIPLHEAQLLTYLRCSSLRLGLLLNFHSPVMRAAIKRVVNRL